MTDKQIAEIENRLAVHITPDEYRALKVSGIAQIRRDAKYLLAEVKRLKAEKDAAVEIIERAAKNCNHWNCAVKEWRGAENTGGKS